MFDQKAGNKDEREVKGKGGGGERGKEQKSNSTQNHCFLERLAWGWSM